MNRPVVLFAVALLVATGLRANVPDHEEGVPKMPVVEISLSEPIPFIGALQEVADLAGLEIWVDPDLMVECLEVVYVETEETGFNCKTRLGPDVTASFAGPVDEVLRVMGYMAGGDIEAVVETHGDSLAIFVRRATVS